MVALKLFSCQTKQNRIVKLAACKDVSSPPSFFQEAELLVQPDQSQVVVQAARIGLLIAQFLKRVSQYNPDGVLGRAVLSVGAKDLDPKAECAILLVLRVNERVAYVFSSQGSYLATVHKPGPVSLDRDKVLIRNNVIGTLFDDLLRYFLLTSHGINGHGTARDPKVAIAGELR